MQSGGRRSLEECPIIIECNELTAPHYDVDSSLCSACTTNEECSSIDSSYEYCMDPTNTGECKVCGSSTCTSITASRCNDNSECIPCVSHFDCSHILGTLSCKDSICVGCTTWSQTCLESAPYCINNACYECF